MVRFCFFALGLAIAVPPSADAQMRSAAAPEAVAAMEALSMMVGTWEGTSTTRIGPDSEHVSSVRESAAYEAGGEILVVEGRGTMKVEGEPRVDHDAFGVIAWEPATRTYRMRSYRAGQGWVDAEVVVDGPIVSWTLESPRGPIRFEANFGDPGRWIETGSIRREGAWVPFLRMELERIE